MYKQSLVIMLLMSPMLLIPQHVRAAELLFKATHDQNTIEVWVDPQSKEINVVEGAIKFSGGATDGLIVHVENGQSILPMWPTPPLYNRDSQTIEFVGGVPDGFTTEGLLFRLKLSPTKLGDLEIDYVDGAGYLNDGLGTKVAITSDTFTVTQNEVGSDQSRDDFSDSRTFAYATIILLVIACGAVILRYVFKKSYTQ
jgi:hypothetical protein